MDGTTRLLVVPGVSETSLSWWDASFAPAEIVAGLVIVIAAEPAGMTGPERIDPERRFKKSVHAEIETCKITVTFSYLQENARYNYAS